MAHDDQRGLFRWQWPAAGKYPLNNELGKVGKWIKRDIQESDRYLILTGFSSLEYLIARFGREEYWEETSIDIVLGNEPVVRENIIKENLAKLSHNFSTHIAEYWLNRGISIKLNGPLLSLIKALEEEKISFRIHPNLHGKAYAGAHHLMVGSSNFSYSGMEYQAEINVRYEKGQPEYRELKGIADHFLSESKDYNEHLLELLNQLLQLVDWEEALARAVAELLEGDWVDRYFQDLNPGQSFSLWPTQRQAIGQGLYILDNEGSVLIAEPTGSGKTRVGAHLLAALLNRFWQQGRGSRSQYKIIAPPLVTTNWQEELDKLYFTIASPISHGILSFQDSTKNQSHLRDIKNANVLLVDEAHNYLNVSSKRTKAILSNKADHVILFTATPINRKWNDLLRMIELLGLDNLSESAFNAYKKLKRSRRSGGAKPGDEVLSQLKEYSQKFIVRRTKREINKIIDKRPNAFIDGKGNLCRFPEHVCHTYRVKESVKDIALGRRIDELCDKLNGIIFVQNNLQMTDYQAQIGVDPENYVKGRLKGAKALTKYNIKNCLRSSRAALLEHIEGTKAAMKWAGISYSKTESGNIASTLRDIKKLPKIRNIEKQYIPDWLIKENEYFEAVNREIQILEEIAECVKEMSGRREESKADFLAGLVAEHSHVLAFDEIVITHAVIHQLLGERVPKEVDRVVATGGTKDKGREEIQNKFNLASDSSTVIGLCTDALSEGVNLQKSSAVVFLDMPTVIRKAEQRAGRVDRLDSPYDRIDIFWPEDHKLFQLEVDKKFIVRHDLVDTIIGSNIEVPEALTSDNKEKIDPKIMEEIYKKRRNEDKEWEGVDDAFKTVREFIGEDGLIDERLYETYKNISATVLSKVSIVKSDKKWGFFALRGTQKRAPKWVLIQDGAITRDLPQISSFLKLKLPDCENIHTRMKRADKYVDDMIDRLNRGHVKLLPNKRKLAIHIFGELVDDWIKNAKKDMEEKRSKVTLYKKFQQLYANQFKIEGYSIDCYAFSQLLLDVFHPYYRIAEKNRPKRGRRYRSLRDLKRWLKDNPLTESDLRFLWEKIPTEEPLDKQIAAAIIAVPKE